MTPLDTRSLTVKKRGVPLEADSNQQYLMKQLDQIFQRHSKRQKLPQDLLVSASMPSLGTHVKLQSPSINATWPTQQPESPRTNDQIASPKEGARKSEPVKSNTKILESASTSSLNSPTNKLFFKSQKTGSHLHMTAVGTPQKPNPTSPRKGTNPVEVVKSIFESNGFGSKPIKCTSLDDNFFLPITEHRMKDYNQDIILAVKRQDMKELRNLVRLGRNMQCCNRFGESVVHLSCRLGHTEVLRFLLQEGRVSLQVRDDFGRTPLHDACWTQEAQLDLVTLILEECPDLLLVSDKRGHTPLSYVRRHDWNTWCEFLNENQDLLKPRFMKSSTE